MNRRIVIAACMVALFAGIGADVANAAPDPQAVGPKRIRASRHAEGPFRHTVVVNIASGNTKTVYLKVTNKENEPAELRIYDSVDTKNYKARYFRNNGTNITEDVQNLEANFTVADNSAKRFVLKVKRLTTADPTGCVQPALELQDGTNLDLAVVNINDEFACG